MAKWQGTVVPNSGYVENVYFNTNLSVDEVVSCIENANLTYDEDGFIFLLQGETPNNIICVVNNSGVYGIANFVTQILYFTSVDVGAGFVGWNPEFNGVINIEENLDALPTTENDKLTSLFSITPFTQSQPTTADKLQKLVNGKQYVVDKTNAKAGTSLNIKSKWEELGDVIEGIESGGNALIKGDWKGTVVPNEGYVEKVYFNTSLSVDEVVNILSQLTLVNNGYGIVSNESETFNVIVLQEESVFGIVDFVTETYYFVNNDFLGFTGWNPNFNGIIEVNSNVIAQNSSGDSFGTQNNLLTKLFSTTPFTQSTLTLEGEYDGSTLTITELPKGGWQGTQVPNSGTIEKIYVNTNLSVDEVVNILNNIDYTENEPTIYQTYPVIANSIMAILYVENFGDGTINIEITSGEFAGNVFNVETGWNEDFNGIIEFDNEAVSQIDGGVWGESDLINVGTQNNLLTELFSITPFTQSNAIDIKSLIENDKRIPLQIKLEGIGGGESVLNSLKRLLDYTKSCSYMFYEKNITDVSEYMSYNDTENVIEMQRMFAATKIKTNPPLNTSNVTNMSYMFYNCTSLTSISHLDTSNVTNMSYMFQACRILEKVDLSHYNISSNSRNASMFENCNSIKTIIIRSFGEKYTLNSNVFTNCYHLTGTVNATYNPNGDKDCYIYVPRSMVDTLKSATNWSTYADQIRALEDYTIDGTTTGELDESKVNA